MPQKLTLGPLLYLWLTEPWRDFYFEIADESPMDVVVLGETICSKRLHFRENELEAVIARLETAGKQIRLSTLALVTLDRESKHPKGFADATNSLPGCDIAPAVAAGMRHDAYPNAALSNGFHHGVAGAEWVARLRNGEGPNR